eukprot:CAMPEP_0177498994 /NCGR_PEP_ID=MMETSP0369-20130122/35890_1 /TAXON_ID=447022 ORGANISM="Scrippsiella hangoei-like, Strain SHHI-4" /NCGR_SAMPLE_ID=MMETSP0369 /ASSEMBLY_ACC=CAM_ASM_000364 /LENGTH=74 /DNA_ID=CAMNT_0018976275 /DNA_START=20 /DNA_END=241 /DNA_ORIENTATION=+
MFELLMDPTNPSNKAQIQFGGFGIAPNKDIVMNFMHEGQNMQVSMPDPAAAVSATSNSGPRKAEPGNPHHLGTV